MAERIRRGDPFSRRVSPRKTMIPSMINNPAALNNSKKPIPRPAIQTKPILAQRQVPQKQSPQAVTKSKIVKKKVIKKKIQQTPKQKPQEKPISSGTPRKVPYAHASRKGLRETLLDMIPVEFIPTEKTGYVFGGLFLFVIILSLFFIPFGEVLKGNISINLSVGIPLTFFNFDLSEPSKSPMGGKEIVGLLIDAIILLLLAYITDVVLNYVKKAPQVVTKKEKGKYPEMYKMRKPNFAERVAQKFFKSDAPKKTKPPVPVQVSPQKTITTKKKTVIKKTAQPPLPQPQAQKKALEPKSAQGKIGKPLSKR